MLTMGSKYPKVGAIEVEIRPSGTRRYCYKRAYPLSLSLSHTRTLQEPERILLVCVLDREREREMEVLPMMVSDNSIVIADSCKFVRRGLSNRVWKSMDELQAEGLSVSSRQASSLPSSPTFVSSVFSHSSLVFPSTLNPFPSTVKPEPLSLAEGFDEQQLSKQFVVVSGAEHCIQKEDLQRTLGLSRELSMQHHIGLETTNCAECSNSEPASHVKGFNAAPTGGVEVEESHKHSSPHTDTCDSTSLKQLFKSDGAEPPETLIHKNKSSRKRDDLQETLDLRADVFIQQHVGVVTMNCTDCDPSVWASRAKSLEEEETGKDDLAHSYGQNPPRTGACDSASPKQSYKSNGAKSPEASTQRMKSSNEREGLQQILGSLEEVSVQQHIQLETMICAECDNSEPGSHVKTSETEMSGEGIKAQNLSDTGTCESSSLKQSYKSNGAELPDSSQRNKSSKEREDLKHALGLRGAVSMLQHISLETMNSAECDNSASYEMEQAPPNACPQPLPTTNDTEDVGQSCDDIDHISQENNIDHQEMHSYASTSTKRTDNQKHAYLHVKDPDTQILSKEVTLNEHLQQDQTGREDASIRNFILQRFLPAAQEVAGMEHQSSKASFVNGRKANTECGRTSKVGRHPVAQRTRSRANRVSKGFCSMHTLCNRQRNDATSNLMRSCGFFFIGLKSALLRAQRTVSTSTHSTSAKKSLGLLHMSSHVKVADEVSSFISSRVKVDGGAEEYISEHPNDNFTYSTSAFPLTVEKDAMRYGTNLSNGVCALVGPCDSECKRHSHSRSEKLDIASDTFKQMASLDSVPIDFLNLQLGTKQKEVKAEDPRLTECSCAFAEAISIHGDEKENTKEVLSESQIVIKTTSERNHVGKDADDDEESEPKFFDAFSRLNSIRSNASFYTVGSPKSQSDSLLWQNEWAANYQSYFVDASSQFETAQAFTIEKTPRVLCSQMEDASDASREPSSVSNRFGKALKLEICESMCNESPVYDGTHVLREGDPREGNFPGLQHAAFDGLYSLGVGVVSPIFPAKCQSGNTSLGWPLALSTYQASSVDGFDRINQEKQTEKCAFGLEVSSPPLPPSPRGAWLGKALARSAVKTSPLATLQQKDKLAATRKKLDSLLTDTNGESSWEEVVKGSQVEPGKLRFLEELPHHHPLNHRGLQPLKL